MNYEATLAAIAFVWLFVMVPVVIGVCIRKMPLRPEIKTDELRRD